MLMSVLLEGALFTTQFAPFTGSFAVAVLQSTAQAITDARTHSAPQKTWRCGRRSGAASAMPMQMEMQPTLASALTPNGETPFYYRSCVRRTHGMRQGLATPLVLAMDDGPAERIVHQG